MSGWGDLPTDAELAGGSLRQLMTLRSQLLVDQFTAYRAQA